MDGVDALIGDHELQGRQPPRNRTLVTENLSKGFDSRVQLVVDPATRSVLYSTADFHKPWTIGVTPDPTLQAEVDAGNAILAPMLGESVEQSTVAMPRADRCGRADGRLCDP